MPKATLTSSFGYRDPFTGERKYYGPGVDIEIPDGLARTLGIETPSPLAPLSSGHDVPEGEGKDTLPEDFPGRQHLVKGGIETLAAVRKLDYDELLMVKGIGPKAARQILAVFGEVVDGPVQV